MSLTPRIPGEGIGRTASTHASRPRAWFAYSWPITAAIAAVNVDAVWAGLLVGAGLLAHTAWDVYHHRMQRVVAGSMSLFCAVLDTFLAVVVLAVTLA